MPLSQLENSAAHARCTFVLWLIIITITYQANLLLSLILLSILFIYSSDIVYSSFGIDCANLFLLKSQTISRYVYWTVTTQVRRLVQSKTNGDIFTLLILCVKIEYLCWMLMMCVKKVCIIPVSWISVWIPLYLLWIPLYLLCPMFPTRRQIFYVLCKRIDCTQSMQCISFVVQNNQYAKVTWSMDLVSWVNWVSSSSKVNQVDTWSLSGWYLLGV